MKFLVIVLSLLFNEPKLETLRSLYYQAASDGDASKKMNELVSNIDKEAQPVLICYKGAAQMFKAKYTINPISKLSNFKTGKKYIEFAVAKEPNNVEIRFVRLAIQQNLPSFLGYSQNIDTDKAFLRKNVGALTDATLKKNITTYLNKIDAPKK